MPVTATVITYNEAAHIQADLESLKGKVKVTPKVELDWEHAEANAPHAYYGGPGIGPYVSIPGAFKPGTTYKIHVDPGVKDIFAFKYEDFTLENYQAHPHIKAPVAV